MTRKRFVKLLMARGRSRNDAKDLAVKTVQKRLSYDKMYKEWKTATDIGFQLTSINSKFVEGVHAFSSFVKTLEMLCAEPQPTKEPSLFGGVCPRCGGTGVDCGAVWLAQMRGPYGAVPPHDDIICPMCFGVEGGFYEASGIR